MSNQTPEDARRGVALLAATLGVAIVAALATGVARWTQAGARLAAATADALQADALTRSGLAIATAILEERRRAALPDTLSGILDGSPLTQPLAGGTVTLTIEDAGRRIDLGAPDLAPALRRLLAGLGLDPALADTLADWTDADDVPRPYGAERAWYAARRPPLAPPNTPLRSPGELGVVRGWTPAAVARVRPFVATAGERAVNPNTASLEVLTAWLGDENGARALLSRRARRPVACTGMPACATTSAFYLVRAHARVRGAIRSVDAVVWVPPRGAPEIRSVWPSTPDERRQPERLA